MTIAVLVVDDDYRVAALHARFVDGVPGFATVGVEHTAAGARAAVQSLAPDLVLLDNYLPDESGVVLAAHLPCDVILVTADGSSATVRAAFAAGALNYVVKPFSADLLGSRLIAYARYRQTLPPHAVDLTQADVDRAVAALHQADRAPTPKGQSPVTSRLVAESLQESEEPLTAAAVADRLGIARATAQRYLAALADDGRATMTLRYGTTGRPEHQYAWVARRRR